MLLDGEKWKSASDMQCKRMKCKYNRVTYRANWGELCARPYLHDANNTEPRFRPSLHKLNAQFSTSIRISTRNNIRFHTPNLLSFCVYASFYSIFICFIPLFQIVYSRLMCKWRNSRRAQNLAEQATSIYFTEPLSLSLCLCVFVVEFEAFDV